MEPGRELDKLVAVAMGWTNIVENGVTTLGEYYDDYIGTPPDVAWQTEVIPHFSTDWAAAGAAWEWLVEKEKSYQGQHFGLGMDSGKPSIWITDWSSTIIARGKTFPHAIALAIIEVETDARLN